MGLIEDIGEGPAGVDTAVFIYFIQEHPRFLPVVLPLFEQADAAKRELVTSALTLLEVLVVPYRTADVALAERYEALLTRSRGIRLLDIDARHLRDAAVLRAQTRVRTPDALQIAAAISAGCQTFVTNDRDLPRIPGLRVIQLSAYV